MRFLGALLAVFITATAVWAQDVSTQIIGGTTAPAGSWPATVGLLSRNVSNNYQAQFCGGSLIGQKYVLTAAHCVDTTTAGALQVLVGTQSLESGGRRINVSKIFVHPKWNSDTSDYDVALLKLSTAVTDIKPLQIIQLVQEATLAAPGKPVWIMGWGDTDIDPIDVSTPTAMKHVRIALLSRTTCNGSNSYDGALTSRMICAGPMSGGKDTCQGDSGGPLIGKNSNGAYRLQIGIVSWGEGCALPNFPGVYTRVAYFRAWIVNTMASNP